MTDVRAPAGRQGPGVQPADQDGQRSRCRRSRAARCSCTSTRRPTRPAARPSRAGCATSPATSATPPSSGISPDTPGQAEEVRRQVRRSASRCSSDTEHAVAEAFGVWGEKKNYGKTYMGIIRSAFLIDEKGKIEQAWYKISPKDTPDQAASRRSRVSARCAARPERPARTAPPFLFVDEVTALDPASRPPARWHLTGDEAVLRRPLPRPADAARRADGRGDRPARRRGGAGRRTLRRASCRCSAGSTGPASAARCVPGDTLELEVELGRMSARAGGARAGHRRRRDCLRGRAAVRRGRRVSSHARALNRSTGGDRAGAALGVLPPFQSLVDEHRAPLYSYLVAALGPHDGADCFQETMLAALRAYPTLTHAGNLARMAVHHRPPQGRRLSPFRSTAPGTVRRGRRDDGGRAGAGGHRRGHGLGGPAPSATQAAQRRGPAPRRRVALRRRGRRGGLHPRPPPARTSGPVWPA